jgi:hypothetical protein
MRTWDIVSALTLLALSLLIVLATYELPYWSQFAPGPSFMSLWVAGTGFLIGGILLAQALRMRGEEEPEWPDRTGVRRVVLGIGALVLLVVMLPTAGALVAGFVFMMVFLMLVEQRPLVPSLFTAVVTVALFEVVFVVWLKIDLPDGVVGL